MIEEQLLNLGSMGIFCAYLVWQNKNLFKNIFQKYEETIEKLSRVIEENTKTQTKIIEVIHKCPGQKPKNK